MAPLMVRASFSIVEYLHSHGNSFLLKYKAGSSSPSPSCERNTPNRTPQVSVCSTNPLSKSRLKSTGSCDRILFRVPKASSHSAVLLICQGLSYFRSEARGGCNGCGLGNKMPIIARQAKKLGEMDPWHNPVRPVLC